MPSCSIWRVQNGKWRRARRGARKKFRVGHERDKTLLKADDMTVQGGRSFQCRKPVCICMIAVAKRFMTGMAATAKRAGNKLFLCRTGQFLWVDEGAVVCAEDESYRFTGRDVCFHTGVLDGFIVGFAVCSRPSWKPLFMWAPSQKGLLLEEPQRQSVTRLRTS